MNRYLDKKVLYALQRHSVLVTGGAGFIGSHVVQRLAERKLDVTVLDNLSTGKLSNIDDLVSKDIVRFVEGDIRDAELVKKCVNEVDAVVHLAAQISVTLSIKDPAFNNDVNIGGTLNLLNSSVEGSLSKFVFISSCAVYGDPVYLPLDEKHPTNPISPYAESKLAAEQKCLALAKDGLLDCAVLRFFNVYGPRQSLNEYSGVITKFMERIMLHQPLTIYGDGQQTRDFVFVDDIVNGIMLTLDSDKSTGEIFNVGSGVATSVKALAQTMLSLTGAKLDIVKAAERPGEIKHSYGNVAKGKQILGYQPNYSLERGLKELLNENSLLKSP